MITVNTIESFRGGLDIRPGDLPFEIWQIFDRKTFENCSSARIVPLSELVSVKDHRKDPRFLSGEKPDARQTAFERMVAAANGFIPRREPVKVEPKTDGTYHIVNGNATAQVLMLAGWKEVPVELLSEHERNRS